MKSLLKEKILLEEPEEEKLPDAVLDEPVVISTETSAVEEEIKGDAFINILSSELSDTYNNISNLKSIVTTIATDAPEKQEVIDVINAIIDDRTVHVGMIQKAIDLLDSKHKDLVSAGEEKAETIASELEANELNKEEE